MRPKVTGTAMAGGGVAALLAWAWNGLVPEYPMPAEVAAAIGTTIVGPLVKYAVSWAPKPRTE